ncbi:MAG TPA: hypothetical protein VK499_07325 [Propionibacteriaceae bacterium]|jgi:hypothetical protein|nr:hypothetical protein [Propionibacteriaceae bacterium]
MEGDHEPAMFGVFETAAGMLLGRKNYQGFAAVWPPMAGDGRWADRLNPMPKWVASTTLSNPLEWNATPGIAWVTQLRLRCHVVAIPPQGIGETDE